MRATSTRLALAATASALVLGLAACGDSDDGHGGGSMPGGSSAGSSASASASAADHAQADVTFSTMMVPHHLQAIEMADLVPSRSTDAELLTLAGQIKAAQQPEVDQMTSWLGAWGAEPVLGHDEDMGHADAGGMMSADDLRELAALTGPAFDARWLELMIRHHEGAVDMAQEVIRTGRHAPTRQLAVGIIEAQQREITRMTAMLAG